MSGILKQSIGVDISQEDFAARISYLYGTDLAVHHGRHKKFNNSSTGYEAFVSWIDKHCHSSLPVLIVMEATGVYYEGLAYYLAQYNYDIAVLLPNQVHAFAKSFNQMSKTDPIDAALLARMGCERQLRLWQPLSETIYKVKRISRQRQALVKEKTRLKNKLHAEKSCGRPIKSVMDRYQQQIDLIKEHIEQIEQELKQICANEDPILKQSIQRLTTITGIGQITAVIVLAETNGFELFTNRSQLVKYAGYDVVYKQSGSSLNAKTRISKRGNSRLRACLYMPSMRAAHLPGPFQNIYDRVVLRSGSKMKALVAVQRKLLTTMMAIHKNETDFDADFFQEKISRREDISPTVDATELVTAPL